MQYASITVNGGSYTSATLTDITGTSLYANNGGSLTLPSVTGFTAPAGNGNWQWIATGASSTLDLPNLTNIGSLASNTLIIKALQGGAVDLPALTTIATTDAIASATESGNTVTITTTLPQVFQSGTPVTISGVGTTGYNGVFSINVQTPTTFTYNTTSGLAADFSAGTAVGITRPVQLISDGSGSTIDVSNLDTFPGFFEFSQLTATNHGTILDPLLLNPTGIQITLEAPAPLAQLAVAAIRPVIINGGSIIPGVTNVTGSSLQK